MRIKICAALLLLVGLGGCVTYSSTRRHVDDPWGYFNYAARSGAIPVVVVGAVPPGETARIEQAVVAALTNEYGYSGKTFNVVPASASAPVKIVFAFDPPVRLLGSDICAAPGQAAGTPTGERMQIGAIFCYGTAASEVWARLDRPASLVSFEIGEVIDKLAYKVVPREPRPKFVNNGV